MEIVGVDDSSLQEDSQVKSVGFGSHQALSGRMHQTNQMNSQTGCVMTTTPMY